MKGKAIQLCISGILALCLCAGCQSDGDDDSPVFPKPTYELNNVEIIVDKQNPNVAPPPCGTEGSVCGTITDGLLSAAYHQDGVPTILVKSGIYNQEPAYPLQITLPVFLKSEKTLGATILASDTYSSIEVLSAGVSLKGFSIKGGSVRVVEDGSVTIKESYIEGENSNPMCGEVIDVFDEGKAEIENSEIRGTIGAYGNLITLKNNTISSDCFGSASKRTAHGTANVVMPSPDFYMYTVILASRSILKNNIINQSLIQRGNVQIEFSGNTIYGYVEIEGGSVSFDNNIVGAEDFRNDYQGIYVDGGEIDLRNNTITAGNSSDPGLLLKNSSTAFLSNNRFHSQTGGIVIIKCEDSINMVTDGSNTLLHDSWISCDGLPLAPGKDPF